MVIIYKGHPISYELSNEATSDEEINTCLQKTYGRQESTIISACRKAFVSEFFPGTPIKRVGSF